MGRRYSNSRPHLKSGCLRMRIYKARFSKEEKCTCCVEAKQTTQHVLIECEDIHPGVCLSITLHEALAFSDNIGKVNRSAIEISTRRLDDWWQKSRQKAKKIARKLRLICGKARKVGL